MIGSVFIVIIVISGTAAAVDTNRGSTNQSNDWSTSDGSGNVGDGAVIYRGEGNITLVDEDGSTPDPELFERISGPEEGFPLEINPVLGDQPTGAYESQEDDFTLTVRRPRVTVLEVLNNDGNDVAGDTLRADQAQAVVSVEYNYDNAEDVSVTVENENGLDVTDEIVDSSATRNGDGQIGIDPGNVDEGEYTFTVEGVNDLDTGDAVESVSVTITAQEAVPPTAAFEFAPDGPSVDESVTFDASESVDPDGRIVAYRWDFDDDGDIDRTTQDPVTTYTYSNSGSYGVQLFVEDEDGVTGSTTRNVSVRPNARCTASPQQVTPGEEVIVDASASSGAGYVEFDREPNDDWFEAEEFAVTVTYDEVGTYEPRVRVWKEQRSDTDSCGTVLVENENVPPSASFAWDSDPVITGESTTFDAGGSEDRDGRIVEYRWDFDGDGDIDGESSSPSISHTYDEPGEYNVGLEVVDDDGAVRRVETDIRVDRQPRLFEVMDLLLGGAGGILGLFTVRRVRDRLNNNPRENPEAKITCLPQEPAIGRPVLFDGSASVAPDPDSRIVNYLWNIDGREPTAPRFVHAFLGTGEHDVELTVLDNHGGIGTQAETVTVQTEEGELVLDRVHPDAPGNDHENLDQEYLVFENAGDGTLALDGWTVHDAAEEEDRVTEGEHTFVFPDGFELDPGVSVTIHTGVEPEDMTGREDGGEKHHLFWGKDRAVWNNDADIIVVEDDGDHPVMAIRYEWTDAGEYELEKLDVEILEEWFPDVVVSSRDEAPLLNIGFDLATGPAVMSGFLGLIAGATFLRGPRAFFNSWTDVTGFLIVFLMTWRASTSIGFVTQSIGFGVPSLLLAGSLGMLVVGGIARLVHSISGP